MSETSDYPKYVLILVFFVVTIQIVSQPGGNVTIQTINISNNKVLPSKNETMEIGKKYITTFKYRGRLANMIYRCASLYGIGRATGRQPYMLTAKEIKIFYEMTNIFPAMKDQFEIISHQNFTDKTVSLGYNDCCRFEPPSNLEKYNDTKYLKLHLDFLQSYKYFHPYKNDLKKLMQCSQKLKNESEIEAKKIWSNDSSSYKVCVHIRRGDFVKIPTLVASTYEFINPAINFIHKQLSQKSISNISLLLFGDDLAFSKNLTYPKKFTSTTILKDGKGGRAFDMCFAIEYCDTFLISASSSSFSFWIGYLMKKQGTVYYNADIATTIRNSKLKYAEDGFPPEWKKLKLQKNGVVEEVLLQKEQGLKNTTVIKK